MAKVVVLGAGIGGMSVAYELRALLPKEHEVTVVGQGELFSFTPSTPWVAVGWRKPADIQITVRPHLGKQGIAMESAGAERVVPQENRLVLGDGVGRRRQRQQQRGREQPLLGQGLLVVHGFSLPESHKFD